MMTAHPNKANFVTQNNRHYQIRPYIIKIIISLPIMTTTNQYKARLRPKGGALCLLINTPFIWVCIECDIFNVELYLTPINHIKTCPSFYSLWLTKGSAYLLYIEGLCTVKIKHTKEFRCGLICIIILYYLLWFSFKIHSWFY